MSVGIAAGIRQPQVNSLGGSNPLEFVKTMFDLRNMQQQYQSNLEAGQILAASPDLDTAIQTMRRSPNAAWMLQSMNNIREQQRTEADIRKLGAETTRTQFNNGVEAANFLGRFGSDDPATWAKQAASVQASLPKEAQGWFGDWASSVTAGDPRGFVQRRMASRAGAGMTAPEFYGVLGLLSPQTVRVPGALGGPDRVVQVGGLGGSPGAGNVIGGQQPATGFQMDQWKALQDRQNTLDNGVNVGMNTLATVNEAEELLKKIEPGTLSTTRAGLGALAKALGADEKTVSAISGAKNDIDAVQEYEKIALGNVFGSLNQSLPPGSRLNEREFTAQLRATPNPNMQRDAILRIYDLWKREMVSMQMEQKRLPTYMDQNQNNPAAAGFWNSQWTQERQRRGLTTPFRTMDGRGGIPAGDVLKLLSSPDPESRRAFDSHYGAGASARYLD